jgi:hypothetical protein
MQLSQQTLINAHCLGAGWLGIGLIYGTWAWHRVRMLQRSRMPTGALLIRLRRVYLLTAVPGSLLAAVSGGWLWIGVHGLAWGLTKPWLYAMVGVTAIEFIEGALVTRRHLDRALALNRRTDTAINLSGSVEHGSAHDLAPHLDLPLWVSLMLLGILRPGHTAGALLILAAALGCALLLWRRARRGLL